MDRRTGAGRVLRAVSADLRGSVGAALRVEKGLKPLFRVFPRWRWAIRLLLLLLLASFSAVESSHGGAPTAGKLGGGINRDEVTGDASSTLLPSSDVCSDTRSHGAGGLSRRAFPDDEPEGAFLSTFDQIRQPGSSGMPILVDVRRKEHFERFRLPGSIHIPLYALKTRPFLKSKRVVLVGEGYDSRALIRECRRLREAGFRSVSVLEGGVNRWRERGGPIDGDRFALAGLDRLSPSAFTAGIAEGDWVVAGFGLDGGGRQRFPISDPVLLPDPDPPDAFVTAVRKLFRQGGGGNFRTLVLFDTRGEGYAAAATALRASLASGDARYTVFYLDGGLAAYEAFEKGRELAKKGSTPKRVRRCGACP